METLLVILVIWEDAADILGTGNSTARCPAPCEAPLHGEELSHVAPDFQVLPFIPGLENIIHNDTSLELNISTFKQSLFAQVK